MDNVTFIFREEFLGEYQEDQTRKPRLDGPFLLGVAATFIAPQITFCIFFGVFLAVVFAAGAGAGSGAPRKDSVDRAASVLMAGAAERAAVRRFVQISTMGAGQPPRPGTDEVWAAYITAKTAAEDDLRSRDLGWTILRPGGLTDAPATGLVRLAAPPVPRGTVARADVAAVIAALLDGPGTSHQTLELTSGDSPVAAAVRGIS